jgi:hypothetical protein
MEQVGREFPSINTTRREERKDWSGGTVAGSMAS